MSRSTYLCISLSVFVYSCCFTVCVVCCLCSCVFVSTYVCVVCLCCVCFSMFLPLLSVQLPLPEPVSRTHLLSMEALLNSQCERTRLSPARYAQCYVCTPVASPPSPHTTAQHKFAVLSKYCFAQLIAHMCCGGIGCCNCKDLCQLQTELITLVADKIFPVEVSHLQCLPAACPSSTLSFIYFLSSNYSHLQPSSSSSTLLELLSALTLY